MPPGNRQDTKYRQFILNCFKILPRQALHAAMLGFIHPKTKEHLIFESPLPEDMQALIEKWRKYTRNMTLSGNVDAPDEDY